MSALAHAVYGASGFEAEKRALDAQTQHEITEATRLQTETGCTWSEALRLAADRTNTTWDDWKPIR